MDKHEQVGGIVWEQDDEKGDVLYLYMNGVMRGLVRRFRIIKDNLPWACMPCTSNELSYCLTKAGAQAELLRRVQEPSSVEPQAPSTASHQTENRGSTTGLEKGGANEVS